MLMPDAEYLGPIPDTNFANVGGPKIGTCNHVIVGSASSAVSEFRNPGAQLSAHFVIAGPNDAWPDGHILQLLDTDLCCYAQGNGNYPPIAYIAKEFAGTPDVPMSTPQIISGAAIDAWAAKTHGFPLVGPVEHGQPGCTTHCHPDGSADPAWGGHPCPGPIRLAQIHQMIALAQGTPTPPIPEGTPQDMITTLLMPDGSTDVFYIGADGRIYQLHRTTEGAWKLFEPTALSGDGSHPAFTK